MTDEKDKTQRKPPRPSSTVVQRPTLSNPHESNDHESNDHESNDHESNDHTIEYQVSKLSDDATRIDDTTRIKEWSLSAKRVDDQTQRQHKIVTDNMPSDKTFSEKTFSEKTSVGIGATLNKRFYLESVLGSGGMGEVYKALDLRRVEMNDDQPYVALKLLRSEFRNHNKFMIALQRESKKVQALSHPNIVTVYDFDRDGDAAYITMELLQGQALDNLITNKGLGELITGESFNVKHGLSIIDKIAKGLAYAHQKGFVHADLKPSNIFYGNDNSIKILDFGIAQAVTQDNGRYINISKDQTDPQLYALTPNYASLEMINGAQPLPVDDIYSMCCVAYELLSGRHPYADTNGKKMSALQSKAQGLQPGALSGVPKAYQKALKKGVSLNRDERFENAGEFLDAIKPKTFGRQVLLILCASALSIGLYFAYDHWETNKTPSLDDLSHRLASSAQMIREGDEVLKDGDIDMAHRFYAQAWSKGGVVKEASAQRVLRRIVDDRIDAVTDKLIHEILADNVDDFRLQQLKIALEFVKADELGSKDKQIDAVLEKIED